MAVTVRNIISAKFAEASQTGQYQANDVKTIIDKFTATNTSAGNVVFSCNLIIASGSAGDNNLIIDEQTILPGESYLCPELIGQVLEDGGVISTLCDTASALTISASGREIS
jgi:hypothetical protein